MLTVARVLLVDDDGQRLAVLHDHLESAGYAVRHVCGVDRAVPVLGGAGADVVIVPPALIASLDRLAGAQCGDARASYIIVASQPWGDLAQRALRAGATEVIDRAWGDDAVLLAVERAMRHARLDRELAMLRARIGEEARRSLVGRSGAMSHVRELIGRAAATRAPVLVLGEEGTGKTLVARLIHDLSDRATRPMLTVRCSGVDAAALEGELFGRAPREAAAPRRGLLEEARGGTIVLEDAFALPHTLRADVLRASLSRSARRVGANEDYPVDVRVVLTVRGSPGDAQGTPIAELLSRFSASTIQLPALRERRSDIPQLVQHIRQRLGAEQGVDLPPLAPEEMLPLLGSEWRGNVRELEQWVERWAMAAGAERPRADTGSRGAVAPEASDVDLERLERAHILRVLALESGHQSRTAQRLGIDRRTLYRKLKKYRDEGALTR